MLHTTAAFLKNLNTKFTAEFFLVQMSDIESIQAALPRWLQLTWRQTIYAVAAQVLLWLWVRHALCQNALGTVWKGIFKPQFDLGVTVLLWFVITVLVYFVYQLLNMYWMYAAEYFFGLPAVVSVRLCKVLIIF